MITKEMKQEIMTKYARTEGDKMCIRDRLHSLYIPKECALYKEYEAGNIQICSKQEYIERLAEFISLLRKDIVVERLFSRIPEKDSAFSNWGNSWWKLTDEWKALMEERQYVQGIRCDYLNGAALNRWEM